jgi:hypothetical protein
MLKRKLRVCEDFLAFMAKVLILEKYAFYTDCHGLNSQVCGS